ncbi:MAG: hypothetical protein Q7J98_12125, partial [Kiritimatiellia bacterium]|nr:hypothetical protein [Kiritimatiellia bacterium]
MKSMRRITGFVFLLAALSWFNGLSAAAAAESARAANAMLSSARVPFVANEGQIANPEVKYYAKTFGGTV